MIPSYCEYIRRYVQPGEHHFVAAYLVPKLFALTSEVPDYINPDGTKNILGDIVYYKDGSHHFGIEVKLGVVRLTKREFNNWVVSEDPGKWPNLFVGVCSTGIGLASWDSFRKAYIDSVKERQSAWAPAEILEGYGPQKSVATVLQYLPSEAHFVLDSGEADVVRLEVAFSEALLKSVGG